MKARVAVLKVKPESILDDLTRVCELAGLRGALAPNGATLLKPNLSSSRPYPASNTTPWQLEGAIRALALAGLGDVACLRSEPMPRALEQNGLEAVLSGYGIDVVDTFDPDQVRWVEYRPRATLRVLQRAFPEGIFLPDCAFGKNLVYLPTLRCGGPTLEGGAMHGALDALLGAKVRRRIVDIERALLDLLAIQRETQTGLFAIMDGTTAGDGARGRIPVVKGYLLASADPVALDAVGAKMMGFEPLAFEAIRAAHEDGLGVGDPSDIELRGDDITHQNWGFCSERDAGGALFASALWPAGLERLLATSPLERWVAARRDARRERVGPPRRDRSAFELWKAETDWGKLFTRYRRGPLRSGAPAGGEIEAQMPSLKR